MIGKGGDSYTRKKAEVDLNKAKIFCDRELKILIGVFNSIKQYLNLKYKILLN